MSDAFFLRWLKDHVSCAEIVRNFTSENADLLNELAKHIGQTLVFRCETLCGPGSGCENGITRGYFSAQYHEIVACDCPGSSNRHVPETKTTLHHELIHATESVLENDMSSPHTVQESACSEIRAYHWADCHGYLFGIDECVRNRSVKSVVLSKDVSMAEAMQAVDAQFHKCMMLPDPTRRFRKS